MSGRGSAFPAGWRPNSRRRRRGARDACVLGKWLLASDANYWQAATAGMFDLSGESGTETMTFCQLLAAPTTRPARVQRRITTEVERARTTYTFADAKSIEA